MAWASISTTTPAFHKSLKLTSWRYYGQQKHEIQLLRQFRRKSGRVLTKQHVFCAASESLSPQTEVIFEALELDRIANLVTENDPPNNISVLPTERTGGKPGFISFHGIPYERRGEMLESVPNKEIPKFLWFVGPTVLVTFLVFPSLCLRRILWTVFEDSLLTDFLILFFTEALFYGGVAIFLLLVDRIWRPLQQITLTSKDWSLHQYGLPVSSVVILLLSLIIPLVTMGMVWPWTGPAASATLAPYLVGLIVQFAFERYSLYQKSPAWSVVPVIFEVYRLHQLNRAAQLVTALSFSVRGAEITSQTMAINSSLGTLLTVLQILGVICVWSLSSFLMRFIPSSQSIPQS